MNPTPTNPFSEAYVTHTVADESFVHYFSPVLVDQAVAIFQPGNVVLKGTQGSGKSMLLRLLDPEIRIAYWKAAEKNKNRDPDIVFHVPPPYRKFITARVDLNKSGLLDIVNILASNCSDDDIKNLTISFGDFFNFWLIRGVIQSVEHATKFPEAFDSLIDDTKLDNFACSLSKHDCWFGSFNGVNDWKSLKDSVKQRVVAYRAWANGNADLPQTIQVSRTTIGEPLSQVAHHLRITEVLPEDGQIYLTVDQMESLWMKGEVKEKVGNSFRREIHEILGRRDSRFSSFRWALFNAYWRTFRQTIHVCLPRRPIVVDTSLLD